MKLSNIKKEEIIEVYINNNVSRQVAANHFGISLSGFKSLLKKYGIRKSDDMVVKCREETCTEKYGVTNYTKTKEYLEKTIATSMEKYGVPNVSQLDETKEKVKQTNKEHFGVDYSMQSKEVLEKRRMAFQKNYGVDNPMYSKDVLEKRRLVYQKNYGVDNPAQSEAVKAKMRETNLLRYGEEYAVNSDYVKNKVKATLKEKYNINSIGEFNQKIFDTREEFLLKNKGKSISEIAREYDCANFTIYHFIHANNLESKFINQDKSKSSYEKIIYENLSDLGIENINRSNRTVLDGQEIDIYIPDRNLGIEFNGNFWHSSLYKENDYHLAKSLLAESKGVTLLHIFENEWNADEKNMMALINNFLYIAAPALGITIDDQNNVYCNGDRIMTLSIKDFIAEPIDIDYRYSLRDVFSSSVFKEHLVSNNLSLKLDYAKALHCFLDDSYALIDSTAPNKLYEYCGYDLFNCGYRIYCVEDNWRMNYLSRRGISALNE